MKKLSIGDIVNIDKENLLGMIDDINKIDIIVFEYDARDRHYQVYYKDSKGVSLNHWIHEDLVKLKWVYKFWIKRESLLKLINKKPKDESLISNALRHKFLGEDRISY